MKKKLLILIMAGVMAIGSSTVVSAQDMEYVDPTITFETVDEDGNKDIYSCPLSECDWVEVDSEGNIVATSDDVLTRGYTINGSQIGPGNTKYYYPSGDPDGFNVKSDVPVKVTLSLSKSVLVRVFLVRGSSAEVQSSNFTVMLRPHFSEKMRLGIENKSSSSITVNGTIEWGDY